MKYKGTSLLEKKCLAYIRENLKAPPHSETFTGKIFAVPLSNVKTDSLIEAIHKMKQVTSLFPSFLYFSLSTPSSPLFLYFSLSTHH
jgi:hypothetical protein